jgi:uncharacterized protein YicC (UPF0701 family)
MIVSINFDPNVLFRGNIANPVSAASWGFTSKNEKHVSAYLDHLEKYLLDYNIESCVHALLEQAPTLSQREVKHCYEAIDWHVTRGMVSSESKIRKKDFKYEWSVALDQAGYRVHYWRIHYLDIKNHSSSPMALAQLKQWAALQESDDDMAWNLDQVLQQLKMARAELKEIQHQSCEKCDKGLRQHLQEEEAKSMDYTDPHAAQKTVKKIEAILWSERQQASYTRINRCLNPLHQWPPEI